MNNNNQKKDLKPETIQSPKIPTKRRQMHLAAMRELVAATTQQIAEREVAS